MKHRILASAAFLALAGCGKASGPLTQDGLDKIKSECGIQGLKLIPAEAGGKPKVEFTDVSIAGDNGDESKLAMTMICVKKGLDASGADYEMTAGSMMSDDIQSQLESQSDAAFEEFEKEMDAKK
jgi:hypothetical protein